MIKLDTINKMNSRKNSIQFESPTKKRIEELDFRHFKQLVKMEDIIK